MLYTPIGTDPIELDTLILDLNGTLSVNGVVVSGVSERISTLKGLGFKIYLFSGDQRGTADEIAQDLGIELKKAFSSDEKAQLAKELNHGKAVSIGNARIDLGTFDNAAIRIATLQGEGIHTEILKHVDILVPSILDALDLLINSNSLCATMRK